MLKLVDSSIKISGITTSIPKITHQKVLSNIGTVNVRRSVFEQTTSDLGFDASKRIINAFVNDINDIGVLIFISRTPDYRSPNTASILQGRLGLSIDCICYDTNMGNQGFNQGIQLVASVLKNANKKFGLLVFGDTPSKLVSEETLFEGIDSDACSALLLEYNPSFNTELSTCMKSFSEFYKHYSVLKGGFRYYHLDNKAMHKGGFQFDLNKNIIANFLKNEFSSFKKDIIIDNSVLLYHSQLFLLNDEIEEFSTNYALKTLLEYGNTYSSNLSLQLAAYFIDNLDQDEKDFCLFSIGEGLSLSCTKIRVKREVILPTEEYALYFDDYRVLHEM